MESLLKSTGTISTSSASSQDRSMSLDTFKNVVFLLVEDSYFVEEGITCRYRIQEDNIFPKKGDQIVLIGLLLNGQKPAIASACAEESECTMPGREYELKIKVDDVSNEDLQDLYQFRYLAAGGVVIGASLPFRLKSRTIVDENLLLTSDENDDADNFTVVSTVTEFVHDRIRTVFQQNLNLVEENKTMRTELNSKISELRAYREENEESKQTTCNLEEEHEKLKQDLRRKDKEMEELTDSIIPEMMDKIRDMTIMINELEVQDARKSSEIKKLSQNIVESSMINGEIMGESQKKDAKIKELQTTSEALEKELTELKHLKIQLSNKVGETTLLLDLAKDRKRFYKNEHSRVVEELKNGEDMINALKSSKELAIQEVKAHKEFCDEAIKDSMASKEDVDRLTKQLMQAREAAVGYRKVLDDAMAYTQGFSTDRLEVETQTVRDEVEFVRRCDYDEAMEKIKDLTERLEAAKNEYKKVYVKNELKKKKIEKLHDRLNTMEINLVAAKEEEEIYRLPFDVAQP